MQVEGSMTLGVLVLALVIVGVRVVTTNWVPLKAVGAIWSYYPRHNRNVSVRFCIAIEILAALRALFRRFFDKLNDSLLAFMELFIQLLCISQALIYLAAKTWDTLLSNTVDIAWSCPYTESNFRISPQCCCYFLELPY